jgi:AmpE protein
MSFLVLLLTLLVEKFSSLRQRIQRDGPWLRLLARLESRDEGPAWLRLALLVLPPLLVLALLLAILQPLLYGWLALPLHLLVLIYSLGRGDLQKSCGPFRDAWRRGDAEAAELVAERDMRIEADEQGSLLLRVQCYLLWQGYQGFFAVIFWYALLGPMAALGYRLLALLAEHARGAALHERAVQLRHGLDFIPARLLVASFALVGNFIAVSRELLHEMLNWNLPTEQLLARAGRAAGDIGEPLLGDPGIASLNLLWQLLVRSVVLWYAAFAIRALLF